MGARVTNTPPLYDTVRPIVDAWAERNLDLSHEVDVSIYLTLLNALLDGDDGLGYAIYIHGKHGQNDDQG